MAKKYNSNTNMVNSFFHRLIVTKITQSGRIYRMKNGFRKLIIAYAVIQAVLVLFIFLTYRNPNTAPVPPLTEKIRIADPTPTPTITLQTPPISKTIGNNYHVFQRFNNCGPASLSMALSYYGINKTQQELGIELRPYQVPGGDNDDKSVTLEEVAEKSKEYGFIPYRRPNGNMEIIKTFITYDIPVITRTWTKPNEDIGHYRIVKGYDSETQEIIQDDSLQGKNLRYSFEDFSAIWKKFNYEYLVLVPEEKKDIAEAILG